MELIDLLQVAEKILNSTPLQSIPSLAQEASKNKVSSKTPNGS